MNILKSEKMIFFLKNEQLPEKPNHAEKMFF